jgi:hypothetical protein
VILRIVLRLSAAIVAIVPPPADACLRAPTNVGGTGRKAAPWTEINLSAAPILVNLGSAGMELFRGKPPFRVFNILPGPL